MDEILINDTMKWDFWTFLMGMLDIDLIDRRDYDLSNALNDNNL